ncbi:hypothetical protein D3C87_1909650 [compost metagenome]
MVADHHRLARVGLGHGPGWKVLAEHVEQAVDRVVHVLFYMLEVPGLVDHLGKKMGDA